MTASVLHAPAMHSNIWRFFTYIFIIIELARTHDRKLRQQIIYVVPEMISYIGDTHTTLQEQDRLVNAPKLLRF